MRASVFIARVCDDGPVARKRIAYCLRPAQQSPMIGVEQAREVFRHVRLKPGVAPLVSTTVRRCRFGSARRVAHGPQRDVRAAGAPRAGVGSPPRRIRSTRL